ncbi:unnamed protein product [Brassicogethes aeneus]|uniref:alpha-1,2-Mannosidase n=1 Tax=Brassicogethes aeneus TaxID=1431903 RepID=A0A9P0BEG8_BRAAE|nr:unnamed protein product [Brassicogethes aeneus]
MDFLRLLYIIFLMKCVHTFRTYTKQDLNSLRNEVKDMFYHAYNSYLNYAYPYDELRPISCDGVDTYGSYSLTLIDALDTLAIMGNYSEFQRVVDILMTKKDFDANINVSVFETNIRIVGGLLSAHLLSHRAGIDLEPGWPCNGPLLRLAEDVAKRLVVAFDSKTGMPYGTVNLHSGVPQGETTVTCTAGVGTFILEFGTLSRLTGDPLYEEVAINALYALYNHKSQLGLFGNHIDIDTGRWTAQDAGIGSGVDSFFEYLLKGSILFQKPELFEMFLDVKKSIDKHLKKEDWYMWVTMNKGQVTLPVFQSLEAYWPGVLSLMGETSSAMKTLHNYHQVWWQYGFTPEFYYIPQSEAGNNRENYPMRPELIESIMYLHRATGDPFLLQAGEDILRSIQHSAKTPCGYATIKDVRDHRKEDRMESFFLAETTKYLYLLFDTDNFIHNQGDHGKIIETPNGECVIEAGGYIFNTEAHPIDPSALKCCQIDDSSKLYDMKGINENRDLFRGQILEEKPVIVSAEENFTYDENITVEITGAAVITTESTSSYMKLEDNDNISKKISQDEDFDENLNILNETEEVSLPEMLNQLLQTASKKFDPQEMLERLRRENKFPRNDTWTRSYEKMQCQAQPFLQRLSIWGEFFDK